MKEQEGMAFKDAVEYVISNKSAKLYSFIPTFGTRNEIVGGLLYILDYEPDEDYVDLENVGIFSRKFLFNDSFVEEDSYPFKYIPKHAKTVLYKVSSSGPSYNFIYGVGIKIILKRLFGLPEQEWSKKITCPDCDQIIFKTGQIGTCDKCKN